MKKKYYYSIWGQNKNNGIADRMKSKQTVRIIKWTILEESILGPFMIPQVSEVTQTNRYGSICVPAATRHSVVYFSRPL